MSDTTANTVERVTHQTLRGSGDLREALVAVLQDMRAGKIGSTQANAAARIGEVMVKSLHVELQVVKELGVQHDGIPTLSLNNGTILEGEVIKNED